MRHRYPLDTLHWLRHQRVDRQAKVVADESSQTVRVQAEEARAEQRRLRKEQAIDELSSAERVRLEEGELRIGDLQVLGDWQRGAATELAQTLDQEQRAREALTAQVCREREARRELGQVSNQAKTIDEHRAAFRADVAAAEERHTEEAVTEQWTASRFPPRRG